MCTTWRKFEFLTCTFDLWRYCILQTAIPTLVIFIGGKTKWRRR